MEQGRHYRSAFIAWAALLVPAGMYGLNQVSAVDSFINPQSIGYGLLIAIFLGWLCKSVVVNDDHLVITRYAGLWRTIIPFADIHFAGCVREVRSYSLTIEWRTRVIRIWPLTCFGMDELMETLPIAIDRYRESSHPC